MFILVSLVVLNKEDARISRKKFLTYNEIA